MELCVLCGGPLDSGQKIVVPRAKGRDTINKISEERIDTIVVAEGQAVHEDCRRNYTNQHNIRNYLKNRKDEDEVNRAQTLRLKKKKK